MAFTTQREQPRVRALLDGNGSVSRSPDQSPGTPMPGRDATEGDWSGGGGVVLPVRERCWIGEEGGGGRIL